MPQLDKLSFATQYFWLTLFFFCLYFLIVNFFVILVFKNLKLRNIIYKIWYFFIYKFDYKEYKNKNSSLLYSCYDSVYNIAYNNFLVALKVNSLLSEAGYIVNQNLFYLFSFSAFRNWNLNNLLANRVLQLLCINKINRFELDEI